MSKSLQETLFELRAVRWAAAVFFLCRGALFRARGRQYRALNDFCWVVRVSTVRPLRRVAERVVFGVLDTIRRTGRNSIVDSFLADSASAALAGSYSLNGGRHELLRDVIVLKKSTAEEKGVVLLKYGRTFDAIVSMFELPRLMERYVFVLEPCWAGFCDPSLLMFVAPGQPVIVQCFTKDDYEFVRAVGAPLVPVKLGPADWVDADLFKPRPIAEKPYDLVMVANWAPHKRHAQLFRALEDVTDRDVRVLLIGFPWGGRTAEHIRREAAVIRNPRVRVDVVERLSAAEVAEHVSQCKAFVFLSRKEGDNKALVEAMFVDVPGIVYEKTVGGASSRVNPATGMFASDEELGARIRQMLDTYTSFAPRNWALQHTGSENATRVLNDAIRTTVAAAGRSWEQGIVEKTNSPNLAYKDPMVRAAFQADYDFILSCRRGHEVPAEAVA